MTHSHLFKGKTTKHEIAESLIEYLEGKNFSIVEENLEKPWGGYLRMADKDISLFLEEFFGEVEIPGFDDTYSMSPKLLIIEPQKLLSWQVHDRRAEFWRVIKGPVGAYRSETDDHPESYDIFEISETIHIPLGIRHRLVGIDEIAIVSEIWIHTNKENPSNEEDIRRILDDFGRS